MFGGEQWTTDTTRYVGVGSSTNTNAGVTGPTETVGTSTTGAWQGVQNEDWKLTTEINLARAVMIYWRTGKTAHLAGTFTDSDFPVTQNYTIREFGIFLGSNTNYPQANPITWTNATNRANAMIIRAVPYTISGTDYIATPIPKTVGVDLTIEYDFADLEGGESV